MKTPKRSSVRKDVPPRLTATGNEFLAESIITILRRYDRNEAAAIPPLTWVRHKDDRAVFPFDPARNYLFLGMISNQHGMCAVIDGKDGCIHTGYNVDRFRVCIKEEV